MAARTYWTLATCRAAAVALGEHAATDTSQWQIAQRVATALRSADAATIASLLAVLRANASGAVPSEWTWDLPEQTRVLSVVAPRVAAYIFYCVRKMQNILTCGWGARAATPERALVFTLALAHTDWHEIRKALFAADACADLRRADVSDAALEAEATRELIIVLRDPTADSPVWTAPVADLVDVETHVPLLLVAAAAAQRGDATPPGDDLKARTDLHIEAMFALPFLVFGAADVV